MWSSVEFIWVYGFSMADCCWTSKKCFKMFQTQSWNKLKRYHWGSENVGLPTLCLWTQHPKCMWADLLHTTFPSWASTAVSGAQRSQGHPTSTHGWIEMSKVWSPKSATDPPTQTLNNSSLNVINYPKLLQKKAVFFQRYRLEVFFTSKFLSSACQQFLTAEMSIGSIAPSQNRQTHGTPWKHHFWERIPL